MAGIEGGAGGCIEPDEGMRTEEMVDGCILFSCNCMDIRVPGGMDGMGV